MINAAIQSAAIFNNAFLGIASLPSVDVILFVFNRVIKNNYKLAVMPLGVINCLESAGLMSVITACNGSYKSLSRSQLEM